MLNWNGEAQVCRGDYIWVEGDMNTKLRVPSHFSGGLLWQRPPLTPPLLTNAPTLRSFSMPPLWTDAARQGGNQEIQTAQRWPSTLIPLKTAPQSRDPGPWSPTLSKQKPGRSWGEQESYSEGLAPSVGHLGNCLSAKQAAWGKGCRANFPARFLSNDISFFCPLKRPEISFDSVPINLFQLSAFF